MIVHGGGFLSRATASRQAVNIEWLGSTSFISNAKVARHLRVGGGVYAASQSATGDDGRVIVTLGRWARRSPMALDDVEHSILGDSEPVTDLSVRLTCADQTQERPFVN
jgi:hypothetical protein